MVIVCSDVDKVCVVFYFSSECRVALLFDSLCHSAFNQETRLKINEWILQVSFFVAGIRPFREFAEWLLIFFVYAFGRFWLRGLLLSSSSATKNIVFPVFSSSARVLQPWRNPQKQLCWWVCVVSGVLSFISGPAVWKRGPSLWTVF